VSFERIVVVGDSCSGKTTLSQHLSERFAIPHIELDQLYWDPNWTPRPLEDFRRSVESRIAGPRWIVDGNYHRLIDLVWGRATAGIWLDYPLPLVLGRAVRRSIRRIVRHEELFAGNRESLRRTFLSHDSLLLWIVTSKERRRRLYRDLLDRTEYEHLEFHHLRSPGETTRWLAHMSGVGRIPSAPIRP
jgi:adenylate kinase family enzyme